MKLNLPRLLNKDYEYAEGMAAMTGIPLDQCPTCLSKPIRVSDDVHGYVNGTYKFRGQAHQCNCELQKLLRKHYLLANIPSQYAVLDWADYDGSPDVRERVAEFLSKWKSFRANGLGLEFYGADMGTGKTFAATHVGKELVKLGERVFFIDFKDIISAYQETNHEEIEARLRESTVLILDEVVAPFTERQQDFFAFKFEELIRHRTNFNLITVMTTNLTPDKLHAAYPRTYSLLEAKQVRTELTGIDARQTKIADENLELALNEEVRPYT